MSPLLPSLKLSTCPLPPPQGLWPLRCLRLCSRLALPPLLRLESLRPLRNRPLPCRTPLHLLPRLPLRV